MIFVCITFFVVAEFVNSRQNLVVVILAFNHEISINEKARNHKAHHDQMKGYDGIFERE